MYIINLVLLPYILLGTVSKDRTKRFVPVRLCNKTLWRGIMERVQRLYPLDEERFNDLVLPIIEGHYIGKGRPPKISHYKAFCGILYLLRTGIPWRDMPAEFGD